MAKKFDEVRIPFAKMTFSPDVPSTALGPNEYNVGHNVETDVRGIRSVAGDQAIMDAFPGSYEPTYVTGGYRQDGKFWFVIATTDGSWYATDGGDDGWYDITPPTITPTPGFYGQEQNITEAWNGTVVFFNDSKTAPMFWPQGTDANPAPNIIQYSQQIPLDIANPGIIPISLTTQRVYFSSAFPITSTPFVAGETIELTGVQPRYFNGIYTVAADAVLTSSFKGYVDILCQVTDAYSSSGQISPQYSWNYNNQWKSVSATFMRLYNSPNVGSILVAGGLTAINLSDETEIYPVTVQWSQAFGLNQAPTTWTPTVTNVANQLEVPLRGAVVDAFPCNGQFFLSSYWDTVVFSPINYATTSTPILGVRLFNQGRGMLTSNAWANTDKLVYGVDARDIWVFDGQDFTGIGNQRIKNYFYNALDPNYVDRLYMEVNTQKNQVEIYFTSKPEDADPGNPIIDGIPNKMISYRYDLDCWNPPREVFSGTFACESPIWLNSTDSSLPYWTANPGSRTIVYARGVVGSTLIQKDQGYAWYDDTAIESEFRRDNIKLLPDYSGKLLVHRIMPEVVNLGAFPDSAYDELPLPTDDANYDQYRGNITVTVYGANSVASNPTEKTPVTKAIDANGNTTDLSPWAQINQNAFRVNSIKLSNASNSSIWMCSATTWQYTQTEDDH